MKEVTLPESEVNSRRLVPTQVSIVAEVNGVTVRVEVPSGQLLIDFLRSELHLVGVKRSCDIQMCGACTVLVDDLPVSSCCYLAVEVDNRRVRTIEGLASAKYDGRPLYQALEDAFAANAAVQCGFCTPGFITTLHFLVSQGELNAQSTDEEICALLRGNLCRCTGYEPILQAARAVLAASR